MEAVFSCPDEAPSLESGGCSPACGAAVAAPLGLSKSHNLSPSIPAEPVQPANQARPKLVIHAGGNFVRLESGIPGQPPEPKDGDEIPIRGKIMELSSKSRARLRMTLAKTRMEVLPLFVHLTYPGVFSKDPAVWKRDLLTWWQRVEHAYPGSGMIWRLEFQDRDAPHFHLFLWGISFDDWNSERLIAAGNGTHDQFKKWLSRSWFEVVGSGDEKHLRAGTRVDRILSRAGAMAYCSGYASKDDQTRPGQAMGRYWGVLGRKFIPWAEKLEIEVTGEQYIFTRRIARKLIQSRSRERRLKMLGKGKKVPKLRLRNSYNVNLLTLGQWWATNVQRILALAPPVKGTA